MFVDTLPSHPYICFHQMLPKSTIVQMSLYVVTLQLTFIERAAVVVEEPTWPDFKPTEHISQPDLNNGLVAKT